MKRKPTNRIFALVRGVTLGSGQGITKGRAKRAAAEQALNYLHVNGLPPPQA